MTSLSLKLSSQAKAMRNLSVPPVTSTVPPLILPRMPEGASGAVGRMVATSKTAGGGGGRIFATSGELGVGFWLTLSTMRTGRGAVWSSSLRPSC